MNTLSEKNEKQQLSLYQLVAEECDASVKYVGAIARGERIPKRGAKGLKVKEALKRFSKKSN